MTRTVYLVKMKHGFFLGYRRGGWRDNRPAIDATFEHARIYTRRSDAESAREYRAGEEVVEATVTL